MNFFDELYSGDKPVLSLEVIPPLKEEELDESRRKIELLVRDSQPAYISVTRRSEGNDENTIVLCKLIQQDFGLKAVPHITAVNHNKETLKILEDRLKSSSLDQILVIRGDKRTDVPQGFNSSAEVIESLSSQFCIAVTAIPEGYPHEGMNAESASRYLREKVNLGARVALSQLFLQRVSWDRFVERNSDLNIPLIPGVMPLTSRTRLKRMIELTGLSIPFEVKNMLALSEEDFRREGIAYTASLIRSLFESGTKGIHLFSFNSDKNTREVRDLISDLL